MVRGNQPRLGRAGEGRPAAFAEAGLGLARAWGTAGVSLEAGVTVSSYLVGYMQ